MTGPCPDCKGAGKVPAIRQDVDADGVVTFTEVTEFGLCPTCRGARRVTENGTHQ